jgi:hypothetical protein
MRKEALHAVMAPVCALVLLGTIPGRSGAG